MMGSKQCTWDILCGMGFFDEAGTIKKDAPEKCASVFDYLKREDRILTLARKINHREYVPPQGIHAALLKQLQKNADVSEKGAFDISEKVMGTHLVRIANRSAEDDALAERQELFTTLGDVISLEDGPMKVRMPGFYRSPQKKGGSGAYYYLGNHKENYSNDEFSLVLSASPLKKCYERSCVKVFELPEHSRNTYSYLTDVRLFVPLALANQIRQVMGEDPIKDDVIRKMLNNDWAEYIRKSCGGAARVISNLGSQIDIDAFIEVLSPYGLDLVNGQKVPSCANYKKTINLSHYLSPCIITGRKADFSQVDSGFAYCEERWIGGIFKYIAEEDISEKEESLYLKNIGHTARVFETKKNIPEKVVSKMESSRFNDYFGYVEFDELVDLEKVDEIYKDFVPLNEVFFNGLKTPDVELRFRLLGRHHALGLYFPGLSCLCVDVRSPGSFAHEYFHMYDFSFGELSKKYEFMKIRKIYGDLLRDWNRKLPEAQAKKLKGSKYNLNYYLTPTEVFARCGEIYLTRIRGVNNSLVEGAKGFAYPEDERLDDAIEEYFSELLDYHAKLPALLPGTDYFAAACAGHKTTKGE